VLHHLKRALWMSLLRPLAWLAGLSLLLLSSASSKLSAQVNDGTIAFTLCMDKHVASFANIDIVGTDSSAEIVEHERRHQWQQQQSIDSTGHCADMSDPRTMLAMEVDAYCVSDSFRLARNHDPYEVTNSTMSRLRSQFSKSGIPVSELLSGWVTGCPKYAVVSLLQGQAKPAVFQQYRLVSEIFFCASDIGCLAWRPYARLGDTPAGSIYVAVSGTGEACLIDDWTASSWKPGQRIACDWRIASHRN